MFDGPPISTTPKIGNIVKNLTKKFSKEFEKKDLTFFQSCVKIKM